MNRKLQAKVAAGVVLLAVTGFSLMHCGSKSSTTPDYSYAGSGSDWSFSLKGDGTFTGTEASGVSISGTYVRLSSGFLTMTVTASSGTGAPAVGSVANGLEVPGVVLFVKPLLSSESQIITTIAAGSCPTGDFTANWIYTQYASGLDMTSTSQEAFGTFRWTNATSTPTLPSKFALQAYTNLAPGTIGGAGTCSGGIMSVTGAKMYLTAVGGALVKMTGGGGSGNAVLALPAANIGAGSALAGNYAGLLFDSGNANKIRPMAAVVNGAGTSITANGLADDLVTADTSVSGTIAIDHVDLPSAGFIEATLTASGQTGKLACTAVVNSVGSGKNIIFCVGQSPGSNTHAFTILFASH